MGGEFPTEVPFPEGEFKAFVRWRWQRRGVVRTHRKRGELLPRVSTRTRQGWADSEDTVTWAGHASVVSRLDGRTILSDPCWSKRVARIVPRLTPATPTWEELPKPALVTISHNHYDHLDAPTIRRLPRDTPIFVPRGVAPWLRKRGFDHVQEFQWWQTRELDGLRVTFVPSQHFSGRTLWDRNKSLWGGWVVEGRRHSVYHAGDTGYFPGFREIGRRFPDLDVACVPIGAYLPRWFMRAVHVDPDEAGQAFLDLGARRFLGIHWGTFRLSDEAMDEPPGRARAFFAARGLDPERLWLPDLGQTMPLDT